MQRFQKTSDYILTPLFSFSPPHYRHSVLQLASSDQDMEINFYMYSSVVTSNVNKSVELKGDMAVTFVKLCKKMLE